MSITVDLASAQRRLAVLWFSWAPLLFVVIFLQSVFGRYGDRVAEAWQWLLPTVVPTLSLIIGVLVTQAQSASGGAGKTSRLVYRIAVAMSIFYLLLVSATLLLGPVAESSAGTPPLELMAQSHLWLAPTQGVVAAALGAFFVRREDVTVPSPPEVTRPSKSM